MQLSLRPSSKAISTIVEDRGDPTLPAILEFQSPSIAIITAEVPRSARGIAWIVSSCVVCMILALTLIHVDRVVTAQAVVVSKSSMLVVQPLETAIVRSINVHEGEQVRPGQVLARLDPTFASADQGALAAQVAAYQAQVSRLQAEADGRPFSYTGTDPDLLLQAAIFGQRKSEYDYKIENYAQKINSLVANISKAKGDVTGYRDRLALAVNVESMRKDLERLQVGSKLNTLAAMDNRAEMERNMHGAQDAMNGSERDLAAEIAERQGFVQSWRADISQQLSDTGSKLSDARESLNKAQLRRQLVELRADRDAIVLSVAKVSVGSVLQSGQEFITLVPADSPLEIEGNIAGNDDGFVNVGDPVALKFDTFPYTEYGMAYGTVRTLSASSFTSQDDQRNPTGAVPLPNGAMVPFYFRARITIDRIDLRNTPKGFRLIPGMPVTADIKVGKRTVMEYLLSRVMAATSEGLREP
jgi:HlyD family secretion protein